MMLEHKLTVLGIIVAASVVDVTWLCDAAHRQICPA